MSDFQMSTRPQFMLPETIASAPAPISTPTSTPRITIKSETETKAKPTIRPGTGLTPRSMSSTSSSSSAVVAMGGKSTTIASLGDAIRALLPTTTKTMADHKELIATRKPAEILSGHVMLDTLASILKENRRIIPSTPTTSETPLTATEELVDIVADCNSSYDDELLHQCGYRTSPVNPSLTIFAPPCVYGDSCQGMTNKFTGEYKPFILMGYMNHADLLVFLKTGALPKNRPARACIICYRYTWQSYVCNIMAQGAGFKMAREICIQTFYNAMDKKDGYRRECCTLPSDTTYNGILHPVAGFRVSDYKSVYDERSKKYRLNQDRMKYEYAVLPNF